MAKYKRVLIKLSGEALGDHGKLFDFEQIDRVASSLESCTKPVLKSLLSSARATSGAAVRARQRR